MPDITQQLLDVLSAHRIIPEEAAPEFEPPEVRQMEEHETVYATSLAEVMRQESADSEGREERYFDNPQLDDWLMDLDRLIEEQSLSGTGPETRLSRETDEPVEPHCAWYCPIHFFGHDWGIYIRESCVLSAALEAARFVDWSAVKVSSNERARQLLRGAFYQFFLHEQFHHKVESFGFRLLVATGDDRYTRYKKRVYRPTYLTSDCLEESLANADSFRRLSDARYKNRFDAAILQGMKAYLRSSIALQPPGYREGTLYLSDERNRQGLALLQSRIVDGSLQLTTPPSHWKAAPNMITALADISREIYVVLPKGARPIFNPTTIDPGYTASTRDIEGALVRHYGYSREHGGKGSHVKLKKPGAPTIILSGNRSVVSPGLVKQVLNAFGGAPLSRLPDLLEGKL